jgi:superfamily II DNA/RNA helicase
MSGRDTIGIAQTGTGKTAAFALPILHRLAASPRSPVRKSCRVLVLSPTRELVGQILDSFHTYGHHLRVRAALAIGGVSMDGQVRAMRSDWAKSNVSFSTRPTACSTWVLSTTSVRLLLSFRSSGRP